MATRKPLASLERALDVLTLAAAAESGLDLRQIAAALGLTNTTSHNVVQTLVKKRFLARTGDRRRYRYRLGPAIAELMATSSSRALLAAAENSLRRLVGLAPQATVTFCEPEGYEILVRLRITPQRPDVMERPLRQALSPYGSAPGLLLHAFWDHEHRNRCRQLYPFWEQGVAVWQSTQRLDQFLDDVVWQGYVALKWSGEQACLIAAPIVSDRNEIVAALGLRIPLEDDQPDQKFLDLLRDEVLSEARRLGEILGQRRSDAPVERT